MSPDAIMSSMHVLKLEFQYAKVAVNHNENVDRHHNERVIVSVWCRVQASAGGDEGLITKQSMQRGVQSFISYKLEFFFFGSLTFYCPISSFFFFIFFFVFFFFTIIFHSTEKLN